MCTVDGETVHTKVHGNYKDGLGVMSVAVKPVSASQNRKTRNECCLVWIARSIYHITVTVSIEEQIVYWVNLCLQAAKGLAAAVMAHAFYSRLNWNGHDSWQCSI